MASEGTAIKTGVARIVWGHPMRATKKTDQRTRQPILKDGQPVEQWTFGLAIPIADFERDIWPLLAAETAKGYPGGAPNGFSYKFKNGDKEVDRQGKPLRDREGYAGHYVLTVSTEAFAPPCYIWSNNAYTALTEAQIKTGDYVIGDILARVNVPSDRTHTPGLYINPVAILKVGDGEEIKGVGAADPTQSFGAAPPSYALPAGASAPGSAPAAPATTGGPTMPTPGNMPAPAAAPPPPAPVTPPAPAAGPTRPTDPTHIAPDGKGGELWWNVAANEWQPGAVAPAAPPPPATLPPPAPNFVANAGMPPAPGR